MARELLLLRHGKSDWSVDVDDFNRPLTKRGKKAALKVGKWMQQQHLIPDWIICSPALRAMKTAQGVCEAAKIKAETINSDERIYQAGLDKLKAVLADCPERARRVLLVGHNPDLETLLTYLVEKVEIPDDGKLMATATLARLKMPEEWHDLSLHCAELLVIKRAKTM